MLNRGIKRKFFNFFAIICTAFYFQVTQFHKKGEFLSFVDSLHQFSLCVIFVIIVYLLLRFVNYAWHRICFRFY